MDKSKGIIIIMTLIIDNNNCKYKSINKLHKLTKIRIFINQQIVIMDKNIINDNYIMMQII